MKDPASEVIQDATSEYADAVADELASIRSIVERLETLQTLKEVGDEMLRTDGNRG